MSDADVPAGEHELRFEFERTGPERFGPGGIGRLYVDGRLVGEGAIARTVPFLYQVGSCLNCGRDEGNPVTEDYASPFAFTGTIKRVIVEVAPGAPRDLQQEMRIGMARQ